MQILDLVQWPAVVITVVASWLVGSLSDKRRTAGFWLFLFSNILWVIWGFHDEAYALITLQVALAAMNIRGVSKNEKAVEEKKSPVTS